MTAWPDNVGLVMCFVLMKDNVPSILLSLIFNTERLYIYIYTHRSICHRLIQVFHIIRDCLSMTYIIRIFLVDWNSSFEDDYQFESLALPNKQGKRETKNLFFLG